MQSLGVGIEVLMLNRPTVEINVPFNNCTNMSRLIVGMRLMVD